jgi:hypothetical protein
MANYLDGMDGGKHNSDNIEVSSICQNLMKMLFYQFNQLKS